MLLHKDAITYSVLAAERADEAADVVARGFVDEPAAAVLVPDPQQRLAIWRCFVSFFRHECIANGLSIMAVDDASAQMVGCLYVRDYRSPLPAGITVGLCHVLTPLIEVLQVADARYEAVCPPLHLGGSCTRWLRVNTRGLPGDRYKGKKV